MQNEKELIQSCLRGNREAFGPLVKKYQTQVLQRARAIVNNDADAKDIAQQTFLKAYLNLHTLKKHEKFKSWLLSIATNESKLWLRDRRNETVLPDSAVSKQNLEEELIQKELVDSVFQAIDQLPEQERQIIEAHLDGKSNQQIAQEQGLSYKAMTHRLYGAKRKVLERIKKLIAVFPPVPAKIYLKKGAVSIMKVGIVTKSGIGILGIGLGAVVLFTFFPLSGEKTPEQSIEPASQQVQTKQQSTGVSSGRTAESPAKRRLDLDSEGHFPEGRSSETPSNMVHEEQVDTEGVSVDTDEDSEAALLAEAEEYLISQIVSWLSKADELKSQLDHINQSIDATRDSEGHLTTDSIPLMDLKRKYEEDVHNLLTLLWDEEIRNYVGDLPREASRDLYELVNPPPPPGAVTVEVPSWIRDNPQELQRYLREQFRDRSSGE